MSIDIKQLFKDQTAWFSESVSKERISLWKKLGGLEVDFDTALFIFSENADSQDTERIYESEGYRDEHLAVFHASYISACYSAPDDKIPLGKYFMPPKEIQKFVRQQMKYIWDDIDSGVSSEEEENKTVHDSDQNEKLSPRDFHKETPSKQSKNNEATTCSTNPEKTSMTSLSPSKNKKQHPPSDDVHTDGGTSQNMQNYSLRKRTKKNYSEMPHIDVENIVLDNSQPSTSGLSKSKIHGHSNKETVHHTQDFYCIEDLPKVTSEMEDLVPGQNGFEVFAKP